MKDKKSVFRANLAQMSFVFLAFALMVLIGCFSVSNTVRKTMSSSVFVALDESEKTIHAYLREPKIAFDNIYMAVTAMLDRGESQEAVLAYLTQTTNSLNEQADGIRGFSGVFGVIRGSYLDGSGWQPSDDFIPQQRPWYQLAIRSRSSEYTAPYVDALSGNVIVSLAQEIWGEGGERFGVLGLDVDLTWMMEYAQSLQFVEGGYGMIVNQYASTVAHPKEEYRNVPLQDLGEGYAEITDMLNKKEEVTAKQIRDTDGAQVITYFRRLYNGWFIGVVMPASSYYADLYFTAIALITAGGVLMLALNIILLRLSAAKIRSDEENKAKSSFLARMSHEIRTPMNAILGMVELLLRKELPGAAREEAAAIKHAGIDLLSIINDILDISKIESNRMEIITAEYHLASVMNDVVNIIRMRVAETSLELIVDIDQQLPSVLEGDAVRLRQVLLNLLSNAVKYTRKGHVSLTVRGEIKEHDTVRLSFEVADTGIGIRNEDLNKLFAVFTQLDTRRNTGVEGTGLGLAIARNLCRLMHGDITVSSTYGVGSVFTAYLPQKIINRRPLSASGYGGAEAEQATARFAAPTARALIVDDIITNLKVAEGLMAPYGMHTDCCVSGPEAIALVRKNDYDIIFMDHMMPEMDGVEAVKAIRGMKEARFSRIPIIALTANAMSGMREMFLECGFSDYLAKPIDVAKLHDIMEKWIHQAKREPVAEPAEEASAAPQASAEEASAASQTSAEEASAASQTPAPGGMPDALREVSGLDVGRGITLTGGSVERYLQILALFCRDTAIRLEGMNTPPSKETLAPFVTQVHALKSALASIGAAGLSAQAAFLEKVGLEGDANAIGLRLGVFSSNLRVLVEDIERALAPGRLQEAGQPEALPDAAALHALKAALEAIDIGAIDAQLDALMRQSYSAEIKAELGAIFDCVLMAEYSDAAGILERLIAACGQPGQEG